MNVNGIAGSGTTAVLIVKVCNDARSVLLTYGQLWGVVVRDW